MTDKQTVKVGILGLGIVGAGLVSLIRKNALRITQETGITVEIEKIFVRSMQKERDIDTTGLPITTNIAELTNNPSIDIICECMGGNGYEQTFDHLKTAIGNGKHVIMSSKKALAQFAEPLLSAAYTNKVHLKYDATVGGGIPIAKVLGHALKGDKILKIAGIFNATSNFIYTKMFSEGQSFAEALKSAQDKGYAENDPSDDVDGFDATNKLIILTLFGMNKIIQRSDLTPESFTNIEIRDMNYAAELGYRIKPVALMTSNNGSVNYFVGPCLIPSEHIIANTFNNFNTIVLEGEYCGELGFYGQGAGAYPTASAMYDDLLNILSGDQPAEGYPYKYIDSSNIHNSPSKFYWRFTVRNETGILADITKILARYKINIERLIQKHDVEGGIELVFLTSNVVAKEKVLDDLSALGICKQAIMPYL